MPTTFLLSERLTSPELLQIQQYIDYKAAQSQALQSNNVTAWTDATRSMADMGDGDALRLLCRVWSSGKVPPGNPAAGLDVSGLKLDSNKLAGNCGPAAVKRVYTQAMYAKMIAAAQTNVAAAPATSIQSQQPTPPVGNSDQPAKDLGIAMAKYDLKRNAKTDPDYQHAKLCIHGLTTSNCSNAVTVLGISIGGPFELPTCSKDKNHPETCSSGSRCSAETLREIGR
jgi:hypothetical protein